MALSRPRVILLALAISLGSLDAAAQTGQDLLNRGRYAEARAVLVDSLEGSAVEAYFETYLQSGELNQGTQRARSMLRSRSEDPHVHYAMGRLHMAQGDWAGAEAAYSQAINLKNDYWRAGLELAEIFRLRGDDRRARRLYEVIDSHRRRGGFTTAGGLGIAGRAAMRLENYHDANEALTTALRLAPSDVRLLIWHGDLYAVTHDEAYAQTLYEQAIEINPNSAEAIVRLAEVTSGFRQKDVLIERALALIEDYAPALSIQAALHLLDGDYAAAVQSANQAIALDSGLLEAWGHLAAAYHLSGNQAQFAEVEARVAAKTVQPTQFYQVVAEDLALRFRYPDAARMAQRAVDADPTDASANAVLGTALMRLGRYREARRHFERSYEQDAFNLYAANTISLLDELDTFVRLESDHFELLIHPDEDHTLGPAILDEAEQAYAAFRTRYPYQPAGKIIIEAFNDPDDFAVRVAGVPHVGLLGVCFGDVIAINTPKAQNAGTYNWARTLWHEIAHTVAIGTSQFHVPRWLTEGLSVFEEQFASPAWKRDMELQFLTALDQDRLHTVASMDRGFTRPTYTGQVMMSYYHAYRVIDYIVEEYTFGSVIDILKALGSGVSPEAAIEEVLGVSLEMLDQALDRHFEAVREEIAPAMRGWPDMLTEEQYGGRLSDFLAERGGDSFYQRLVDGESALEVEDFDLAETHFKEALALYDDYTGPGNPYEGLAAVYRARGQIEDLITTLTEYLATHSHGPGIARELAGLLIERGDSSAALGYFERSRQVEPYELDVLEQMAELYTRQANYQEAVAMRRAILEIGPVNLAEAHFALAESLYELAAIDEAKRAVLQSLEIAPGFRQAQRLLLELVELSP